MKDIIDYESGSGGSNRMVQAGDNTNSVVPIRIYQDIYHQITGRTEQVRKRCSENLLIDFSEIEQLHHKISQLCDVHDVVARSEVVSVFHDKDRKEQFTSFERFSQYNANSSSPTVTVVLQYNFSIIPPSMSRPQEYVVTIQLSSRVAISQQLEEDGPPFISGGLYGFIRGNVAEISVNYVDYVIARGFIEAFTEWTQGCKTSPKKKWLEFVRKRSHFSTPILQLFGAILFGVFALNAVSTLTVGLMETEKILRAAVIYSIGFFVVHSLLGLSGSWIESAIDRYPALSYLNLNKGDQRLIDKVSNQRGKIIFRFLSGIALTILLGVISAKLERLI